jgi:uncharacterized membrane protein YoaK (UPF0700 family)
MQDADPGQRRRRDALLALLTVTTGVADATAFVAVGNVFSSVMTGNFVLLGIAVGSQGAALATSAGVALGGYCAGVLLGVLVAEARWRGGGIWPAAVTLALTAELCLLGCFSLGWELNGSKAAGWLPALLALLAAGMGVQSAAIRRFGRSTTYLTGTLTNALAGLVSREESAGRLVSLTLFLAIGAGAAAGTAALKLAPALLPVALLGPLALVIAGQAVAFRPPRQHAGRGKRVRPAR